MLAGVGGQGVVTVARILAEAALRDHLTVVQGELHGMSQRGGAVHASLRIAEGLIESPQVPEGGADLVVGVEPVESLRSLHWLRPGGRLLSNTRPMENVPDYPPLDAVLTDLRSVPGCLLIDAHRLAVDAGSPRSENLVLAGAAAALLPLAPDTVRAVVAERTRRWPPRDRDSGRAAFEAGYDAIRKSVSPVAPSLGA